jgi:hypothetical protein
MAIPGLLIEYLISGALALLWLAPVLDLTYTRIESTHLALLALGLYVVGMAVDFVAFLCLSPFKASIRRAVSQERTRAHGSPIRYWLAIMKELVTGSFRRLPPRVGGGVTARQIKFALHAPEVAKEAAMRSSRDRIARGALVNAVIATFFLDVIGQYYGKSITYWSWAAVIAFLLAMWAVFEGMSYSYDTRAEEAVDEKLRAKKTE